MSSLCVLLYRMKWFLPSCSYCYREALDRHEAYAQSRHFSCWSSCVARTILTRICPSVELQPFPCPRTNPYMASMVGCSRLCLFFWSCSAFAGQLQDLCHVLLLKYFRECQSVRSFTVLISFVSVYCSSVALAVTACGDVCHWSVQRFLDCSILL